MIYEYNNSQMRFENEKRQPAVATRTSSSATSKRGGNFGIAT